MILFTLRFLLVFFWTSGSLVISFLLLIVTFFSFLFGLGVDLFMIRADFVSLINIFRLLWFLIYLFSFIFFFSLLFIYLLLRSRLFLFLFLFNFFFLLLLFIHLSLCFDILLHRLVSLRLL